MNYSLKNIVNIIIEVLLIGIGIYYAINFKSEATKILERSPKSIRVFGYTYKLHSPKFFKFIYSFLILLGGVIMILLGILLILHILIVR